MRTRGTQWGETWGRCHPCRSCIHYKHSILVDKGNCVVRQCLNVMLKVTRTAWTQAMEENSVEPWQENPCLFDVPGIPPGQKSCCVRSVRWSVVWTTEWKLLTQDNYLCFVNSSNLKTLKAVQCKPHIRVTKPLTSCCARAFRNILVWFREYPIIIIKVKYIDL